MAVNFGPAIVICKSDNSVDSVSVRVSTIFSFASLIGKLTDLFLAYLSGGLTVAMLILRLRPNCLLLLVLVSIMSHGALNLIIIVWKVCEIIDA